MAATKANVWQWVLWQGGGLPAPQEWQEITGIIGRSEFPLGITGAPHKKRPALFIQALLSSAC